MGMDHLYCLICCGEVVKATGSVINQEVVDLDGDIHLSSEVEQRDLRGTLPQLVVEDEEKKRNVFQCFCNLFNVKSSEKGMWSSGRGDQQFSFCRGCSSQLNTLYKLQKTVEELKMDLQRSLEEAEAQFEKKSVYQTNGSYGKIRNIILGGRKDAKQIQKEVDNPPKRSRPREEDKAEDVSTSFSTQTATSSSHISTNISWRTSVMEASPHNVVDDDDDRDKTGDLLTLDPPSPSFSQEDNKDENSSAEMKEDELNADCSSTGTGKNPNSDMNQEHFPPLKNTMADLPPEVVTIILEHLTRNETRKNILSYRLVNSQWRDIIRSFLEKKIISGDSQVFPQMRVHCLSPRQDLLHVPRSLKTFPAGRNPFPANSFVLDGESDRKYLPNSITDLQTVEDLMSRFGGYLTSFELRDVIVPGMNSVITLLSSMSCLKHLSIQNVTLLDRMIKPNGVLPTPPPLPTLTTLVVKSSTEFTTTGRYDKPGQFEEKNFILYVWLIAFYANQLLHLEVKTRKPLPALQRQLQYYYSFPNGQRLSIATTSDSAFCNLTELNISSPNKKFFRLSEFSNLQRLTVNGINTNEQVSMQDIGHFIRNCNALEKFHFDAPWAGLFDYDAYYHNYFEGIPQPPICGENVGPFPKLRCLEIDFLIWSFNEEMTLRFLALLPALETLHFIRFPEIMTATAQELEIINRVVRSGSLMDQIFASKSRLASLKQRVVERNTSYRRRLAAIPLEVHNQDEEENELVQLLDSINTTAWKELTEILKGLAALGVKRQDVVLEQFLEGQQIWSNFPKLSLVSASSTNKPEGNVCIFRRPVGV